MKRYVAARIRDAKTEEGLTEENFKVSCLNCFLRVKDLYYSDFFLLLYNRQELKQDISSFRYEVLGMMKCKPRGRVASSTLAYPGNSFKYSPQCPPDKPQEKPTTLEVHVGGPAVSERPTSDSALPSHDEQPVVESEAAPRQKQSRRVVSRKRGGSEEDTASPGGLRNEQLQLKKVIVEVLHKVEKDVQEMESFAKSRGKETKNGPKKCKNSSVLTSDRC